MRKGKIKQINSEATNAIKPLSYDEAEAMIQIMANGNHKDNIPVPNGLYDMTAGCQYNEETDVLHPIIILDEVKQGDDAFTDISQFLMATTRGNNLIPAEVFSNLGFNPIGMRVNRINTFRAMTGIRMLISATLSSIYVEITDYISRVQPKDEEVDIANVQKKESLAHIISVFSSYLEGLTPKLYMIEQDPLFTSDTAQDQACHFEYRIEIADKLLINLSNMIFDTLYGTFFRYMNTSTITDMAQVLTPILSDFRYEVIYLLTNTAVEACNMNELPFPKLKSGNVIPHDPF